MSDVFWDRIPSTYLQDMFTVMEQCDRHTYQILTKRSTAMRRFTRERYGVGPVPGHMHFGVSVENAKFQHRIDHLRDVPAEVRFVSFEPLIGELAEPLDLTGIGWMIVGGESGPKARPIPLGQVQRIRDKCVAGGIPFFFKQWGGRTPKAGGRMHDG